MNRNIHKNNHNKNFHKEDENQLKTNRKMPLKNQIKESPNNKNPLRILHDNKKNNKKNKESLHINTLHQLFIKGLESNYSITQYQKRNQ